MVMDMNMVTAVAVAVMPLVPLVPLVPIARCDALRNDCGTLCLGQPIWVALALLVYACTNLSLSPNERCGSTQRNATQHKATQRCGTPIQNLVSAE